MRAAAKAGDRVRITVEGITKTGFPAGGPGPGDRIRVIPGDVVTVEVIEAAPPKFSNGDVIRTGKGSVAVRRGGAWNWTTEEGYGWDDATTADWLDSGYYTPLRINGRPVLDVDGDTPR